MSVSSTIESLLSQVKSIAKSDMIFGEPITAGETTLIPVSKISMGFGVGGSGKKDGATGTGGGAQITPVALVSVTNGEVKVHTMENGSDLSKVLSMAPDLIDAITKKIKGKK